MSDRFPAQIWIGGQIDRASRLYPDSPDDDSTVLQGLIAALSDDHASYEYGDRSIMSDCTETELLETYFDVDSGWLNLKNDEIRNGEFEDTEAFCVEHGIPFDRQSDSYCEYDGENVYWRPGMKIPLVMCCDSNGNNIVQMEMVRKLLKTVENPRRSYLIRVESLARQIKVLCPEPPELPKFKIVGEKI